jgi:hypothetical protein
VKWVFWGEGWKRWFIPLFSCWWIIESTKTAQDHAAQVAKLKAAKDEADARQAQLQKEMKEEMERLRTQFMFKVCVVRVFARSFSSHVKQHELETSSRRIQWSTQTSRVAAESPIQPKPQAPGTAKKPATLPGFQDAFAASTPLRAPKFVLKDQEQNPIEQELAGREMDPRTPRLTSIEDGVSAISPRSSPTRMQNHPMDAMMSDFLSDAENPFLQHAGDRLEDDIDPLPTDGSDVFHPPNLQDEVSVRHVFWCLWKLTLAFSCFQFPRIVLTHRISPSASITFQKLIEISSLSATGQPQTEDYPSVPLILEALASTSQFDHTIRTTSIFFIRVITTLNERSSVRRLSSST